MTNHPTLALIPIIGLAVISSAWSGFSTLAELVLPAWPPLAFEDPLSIDSLLHGPVRTQAWMRLLRDSGFRVLGILVERLPWWGRAPKAVTFVGQDQGAYASIALTRDGRPAGLAFYTPLQGGGLIVTGIDIAAGQAAPPDDRLPAGLLAEHREHVRGAERSGAVVQLGHTSEAHIGAARRLHRERVRAAPLKAFTRRGGLTFVLGLILLGRVALWQQAP